MDASHTVPAIQFTLPSGNFNLVYSIRNQNERSMQIGLELEQHPNLHQGGCGV